MAMDNDGGDVTDERVAGMGYGVVMDKHLVERDGEGCVVAMDDHGGGV